jgi:hypothetical protein
MDDIPQNFELRTVMMQQYKPEDRVYWKRKESYEGQALYISGYGSFSDVPEYGYVDTCELPTEIISSTDENGNVTAYSPPIVGSRFSYRYVVNINDHVRKSIASATDVYDFNQYLRVLVADSPQNGTTPENWWWYSQDKFSYMTSEKNTPIRLMKKWKRDMLKLLLDGHPEQDRFISRWDEMLQNHKDYVKRNSATRVDAHKKSHDDLVVMPRAISFNKGDTKQIFRYNIEKHSYNKRASHSLQIFSTRYTIAHGEAVTFKDGTAPIDGLSVPIQLAMSLLAWSKSSLTNAHSIIAATSKFEIRSRDLLADVEQAALNISSEHCRYQLSLDIKAAISALQDFGPKSSVFGLGPMEAKEKLRLVAICDDAQNRLQKVRSDISTQEEALADAEV